MNSENSSMEHKINGFFERFQTDSFELNIRQLLELFNAKYPDLLI